MKSATSSPATQCLLQDNETGWVDWRASTASDDLTDFIGHMTICERFAQNPLAAAGLTGGAPDGSYGVLC